MMCDAPDNGSLKREECILERDCSDDAYTPEPFPEHLLEALEWTQILATMDVCINASMPTKFCNDDGYDVIPIQMISTIHIEEEPEETKELMRAQQVFSDLYYDAIDEWEGQDDTSEDSRSEKEREEPRPAYIADDLSKDEEELLLSLLKEYKDVFAWSYKDLKGVDPKICQHTIPTRDDAKPSRQRPYTYNETFARRIKEEIERLKEAKFIYEIEHTDWVSPIVVVPKKNGKLRVCVNLKKVNAATIRDNYPLSITEHVLERVAGKEACFLDGFSGYNQLLIDPKDEYKTAFATEWGIFAYKVMPFGLTNAPATFQRLMSHDFKEYLTNFREVYMDDLCVHSSITADHFEHLKKVYEKCKLYRICLNPKKYIFMARQGKILGHIVSKNGIATDMDKIHVIADLPKPTTVKGVQAFMGHCGYYRRFIYMYAIIAKPMYGLITLFVWTD
ncbi:hypothetical protein L7F22_037445 [Adiantum nelumboides]|nr:hypothetical protein [Adiantum nelumboides]